MIRRRAGAMVTRLLLTLCAATVATADDPRLHNAGISSQPASSGRDDTRRFGTRSQLTIEVRDGYRFITANGIPDHPTGRFPNRDNPNTIRPQQYRFRVPAEPRAAEKVTPADGHAFGVALNGVPYDPGTAEWWKDNPSLGWHIEAIGGTRDLGLDRNRAHVQPSGAYHYHGVPTDLLERLAKHPGVNGKLGQQRMILVGWAADGFPIYGPYGYSNPKDAGSNIKELRPSYRLKAGERPSEPSGPGGTYDGAYTEDWEFVAGLGDLDECNGRFGATPEFRKGTYYYVLTATYPFIPRRYRGTPDASFARRRPPGGPGGPGSRSPRDRFLPQPPQGAGPRDRDRNP